MLRVLKMAWPNLLRHKARTALMGSIVAFGSLAVFLMRGIAAGMFDSVTATHTKLAYGSGGLGDLDRGRPDRAERTTGVSR